MYQHLKTFGRRLRRLCTGLSLCLTLCGAQAATSGEWVYEGSTITSYTGSDTNVTVPAMLDGQALTIVAGGAFAASPSVQNIVLPEGIAELRDNAFAGIESLYSVTLPASIRTIGDVYEGAPIPVIRIPSLEAWMGIDFTGRFGSASDLYVGGKLLETYYPQFDGLYTLKARAFSGIKSLKKSILAGVTEIPERAFAESGLDGIGFDAELATIGDRAFYGCALVEVQLPALVETVGTEAFASNPSLANVILGEGLISIGTDAFAGISPSATIFSNATVPPSAPEAFNAALKAAATLYVPAQSLDDYEKSWGFANTLAQIQARDWTVSDGVITAYNGSATSVVIPEYIGSQQIHAIADRLFKDNENLVEITFPDPIGWIATEAFSGCVNLKKVTLGANCQFINKSAFEGCRSLTAIDIPARVWFIGENAFASSGLTQFIVPEKLLSVGADAFKDCPIQNVYATDIDTWLGISFDNEGATPLRGDAHLFIGGSELTSLNSVAAKSVKAYAFYGLKSLTSASLPAVLTVGEYAFAGCSNLSELRLGYDITTIGNYAFYGCPVGGELNFGDKLFSIGISAFEKDDDSEGITAMTFGENLKVIWEGAFLGHSNIKRISADSLIPAELRATRKSVTPVFAPEVCAEAELSVPAGSSELYAYKWGFRKISPRKTGSLTVATPDNGCFSIINPMEDLVLFVGSTDPEWELAAVYLGEEDILDTQITPEGYWILREFPEEDLSLRIVLKKKSVESVETITGGERVVKVMKEGDLITVCGANPGSEITVHTLSGERLLSTRSNSFTLDFSGVVILSVDNQTFKFFN